MTKVSFWVNYAFFNIFDTLFKLAKDVWGFELMSVALKKAIKIKAVKGIALFFTLTEGHPYIYVQPHIHHTLVLVCLMLNDCCDTCCS